ncbi:MAG: hypothetical protein WA673_19235, partial [Candidatus Acidiferrales bacterium]
MLIRLGYDLRFSIPAPVTIVGMLHVHPSRTADLREPDEINLTPQGPIREYIDSFGNRCSRLLGQQGHLEISCSTLIEDSG